MPTLVELKARIITETDRDDVGRSGGLGIPEDTSGRTETGCDLIAAPVRMLAFRARLADLGVGQLRASAGGRICRACGARRAGSGGWQPLRSQPCARAGGMRRYETLPASQCANLAEGVRGFGRRQVRVDHDRTF